MPLITGPSSIGAFESLALNSQELNDDASYYCEQILIPPAPKRQEWIKGIDADGSRLLRPPLVENRTVTIKLRQVQQPNMDSCLALIGAIVDSIREAELNAEQGGVDLVWTPAGSTKTSTMHVLSGEIVDLPIDWESAGWFIRQPIITIRLDCEAPIYGEWVLGAATVTDSNPVQTLEVLGVPGDMPAELVVRVTDVAGQSRGHVEVAIQNRYYDPATSLEIDSASLVTTGFAGVSTTRAGSHNTNVIRGTLTPTPVAICGLGNLGHIGTLKVKVRVYPVVGTTIASDLQLRLSWREGDGVLSSNEWTTCPAGTAAWSEVDLGYVSIPEATKGTQRWTGQIEAYSTTAGDTLDVDYVLLPPTLEGYGKARAPLTYETVTAFTARDEFNQVVSGGSDPMTGLALPSGGTWTVVTSSDADDFVVEDIGHTAQRTAVSDTVNAGRFLYPNGITPSGTIVQTDFKIGADDVDVRQGVFARLVNITNYISSYVVPYGSGSALTFVKDLVGVQTTLADAVILNYQAGSYYTLRLAAYTSGAWAVWFFPQSGSPGDYIAAGYDADLATGGTLDDGRAGVYDENFGATASTRNYKNFFVATPTPAAVIFASQSAEFRSDAVERADSTGTYWGPVKYRGAHLYLPEAGSANRATRIFVKARRNDIDVAADDHVADSTTVTVDYRPRYYAVPR